jgi:hypothetical protein
MEVILLLVRMTTIFEKPKKKGENWSQKTKNRQAKKPKNKNITPQFSS